MNNNGFFIILNSYKKQLTKQQYSTLKGQIKAGDVEAAMKGLQKLTRKKVIA